MTLTAISPRFAINTLENTSYRGRVDDSNARSPRNPRRFSALEWVEETGSTNADLVAAARTEGREQALVADHQTAGRGRLDRTWEAPADSSVLMSVLVRPALTPAEIPLLTVAMAVAVRHVLSDRGAEVGLKWPNDIIASPSGEHPEVRKVAGVLAETVWDGDRPSATVVGVGINVNWPDGFPAHLSAGSTSVSELIGGPVDRREFVSDLIAAFGGIVDDLESPVEGIASWRRHAPLS